MRIRLMSALLGLALGAAAPALADERTVTLAVDNMTCATCPYTVRQALAQVQGVLEAEVSLEDQSATVTFDDTKTDVAALVAATTNAGYPSRPAQ